MRVVAFVPIKLHSQRLPQKNVLPLGNRPLCHYIFETLLQVKEIDEVYVYCSDRKIMDFIPSGVTFLQRDPQLDEDATKGFDIYRSFIQKVNADIYVLAHATSPFIRTATIQTALHQVVEGKHDSAFSAQRIQTFAWYREQPVNYDLNDIPRTQDMEPIWVETSAFYIFESRVFTEYSRRIGFCPYIQEVSGKEALDIDERQDYELACLYADNEK